VEGAAARKVLAMLCADALPSTNTGVAKAAKFAPTRANGVGLVRRVGLALPASGRRRRKGTGAEALALLV
jgi:hypothetical protein